MPVRLQIKKQPSGANQELQILNQLVFGIKSFLNLFCYLID